MLLRDAADNPVGATTVTATITGAPAGVSFHGTATATTNGSGLATFTGLGLNGPAGSYSLTFTAGAVTSAASNAIALGAGTATRLTYNTQPSTTVASGGVFAQRPVLLLRDNGNNPVASVLVTATITGAPAGVAFVGTATATTTGSGLATFAGLGLRPRRQLHPDVHGWSRHQRGVERHRARRGHGNPTHVQYPALEYCQQRCRLCPGARDVAA